jgi:hypothetical protein
MLARLVEGGVVIFTAMVISASVIVDPLGNPHLNGVALLGSHLPALYCDAQSGRGLSELVLTQPRSCEKLSNRRRPPSRDGAAER